MFLGQKLMTLPLLSLDLLRKMLSILATKVRVTHELTLHKQSEPLHRLFFLFFFFLFLSFFKPFSLAKTSYKLNQKTPYLCEKKTFVKREMHFISFYKYQKEHVSTMHHPNPNPLSNPCLPQHLGPGH